MKLKYLLLWLFVCTLFFLPFFIKPQILTTKENDLGVVYIPLFNFIKSSFLDTFQIPLWRTDQMMGESLVAIPLSALFYPVNILFIILPIKYATILYLYIGFCLTGFFTFLLAKSFRFSNLPSFSAAVFYAFSVKMVSHLAAGHITMLTAFSFFPLSFLSLRKLLEKADFFWLTAGSLSLLFMFLTYPTVFYYAVIFLFFYWLYKMTPNLWTPKSTVSYKTILSSLPILLITTFGLSAISLFPQLEFGPFSTRSALRLEDVAIPLWNLKRFLSSLLFPYLNLKGFDHESLLYLGLIPCIFSVFGLLRLKLVQKFTIIVFGFLTLLFIAGSSAPLFPLAYKFVPLLNYSRVTTRLWFVVALIVSLIAAYGLEKIRNKKIIYILITLFLFESSYIFIQRLKSFPNLFSGDESIYEFLAMDQDIFRIYCTSSCFNAQLLSKYNLQILDGENPIQSKDYVNFLGLAGNYKFNEFAVIFPPYQVWQVEDPPVPNAELLGAANVKYIASTYPLVDNELEFLKEFNGVLLYKNRLFLERFYFDNREEEINLITYSPNKIFLTFEPKGLWRNLVIADSFYPGWFAKIDGKKFNVQEYQKFARLVAIPPNSDNLELVYNPKSIQTGKTISFGTAILMITYFFYNHMRIKNG